MMKKILAGILTAGMLLAGATFATIYQYMDDSGQVNFTNDLSSVPVDKLADIIKFEEYESDDVPDKSFTSPWVTSPPPNDVNAANKSLIRKKLEQRGKFEAEYDALLKEKKELDNNASFQKRKRKRKYQNRPYIKELKKREIQIIDRLKELEAQLKTFETQ
ncbi:MAG: hypothetical protein L3J69_11575 [Desulfobacula sp.]|nr:hypothetical protein [Desulfobacula sp.]